MAETITISNSTRVHDYRGVLAVTEELSVEVGSRVNLTGDRSEGALDTDTLTICRFLDASLSGDSFISGFCEDSVKIPFDSSCTLGVKLYNCENKRVDVESVGAAYLTIQDAFQSPMTTNKKHNRIDYLFSQDDYKMLVKGKVYDMLVSVVDKSGNHSTILKRKVRFN